MHALSHFLGVYCPPHFFLIGGFSLFACYCFDSSRISSDSFGLFTFMSISSAHFAIYAATHRFPLLNPRLSVFFRVFIFDFHGSVPKASLLPCRPHRYHFHGRRLLRLKYRLQGQGMHIVVLPLLLLRVEEDCFFDAIVFFSAIQQPNAVSSTPRDGRLPRRQGERPRRRSSTTTRTTTMKNCLYDLSKLFRFV